MPGRFASDVVPYLVPIGEGKTKEMFCIEVTREDDANVRIFRYAFALKEAAEFVENALGKDIFLSTDENYIQESLAQNFWSMNFKHNYVFCGIVPSRPSQIAGERRFIDRVPNTNRRFIEWGYAPLLKPGEGPKIILATD